MDDAGIAVYSKKVSDHTVYDDELEIAPWEIEKTEFSNCDDPETIEKSLDVIKKDHTMLVLASTDGRRYGNTILINFDDETLSIDKPVGFDENSITDFRVYFRNITTVWSFFEVRVISDCPYSLCATYPENLYSLKRRRRHRVEVPAGTRTVFWVKDMIHNGGYVKDISAAGMMISTGSTAEQFTEHQTISDIAIALPQYKAVEKLDDEVLVILPVISQGSIVRSFRDADTDHICHGISFTCEDGDIERIEAFVKMIATKDQDGS